MRYKASLVDATEPPIKTRLLAGTPPMITLYPLRLSGAAVIPVSQTHTRQTRLRFQIEIPGRDPTVRVVVSGNRSPQGSRSPSGLIFGLTRKRSSTFSSIQINAATPPHRPIMSSLTESLPGTKNTLSRPFCQSTGTRMYLVPVWISKRNPLYRYRYLLPAC